MRLANEFCRVLLSFASICFILLRSFFAVFSRFSPLCWFDSIFNFKVCSNIFFISVSVSQFSQFSHSSNFLICFLRAIFRQNSTFSFIATFFWNFILEARRYLFCFSCNSVFCWIMKSLEQIKSWFRNNFGPAKNTQLSPPGTWKKSQKITFQSSLQILE